MEKFIDGGVTAAKGFKASGVLCRIKESRKTPDVALLVSDAECNAAGIFTQNRVKAECVKLDIERVKSGKARAVIINSGNANACTGKAGMEDAIYTADSTAKALGIDGKDVLVCSTGVIGQRLNVDKIVAGLPALVSALSQEGHEAAARAIMTTDTMAKECAVEVDIGGEKVHIGAMCKGSGMIHLNLGTMLCFITTDAAITSDMLDRAIRHAAMLTFNCVSIDGDTSTNDTLLIFANGMAGNKEINDAGVLYDAFVKALIDLCTVMAKKIAADGEGATRLVECAVRGAKDDASARGLAKAVISSNLVKAAMFGKDANCGRVLCALGYSGYSFDPDKCTVTFRGDGVNVMVIRNGAGLSFDENAAKRALSSNEVQIAVDLDDGDGAGCAWGCDLTYDYVKINGDYRT